jgi:hypothetical protein
MKRRLLNVLAAGSLLIFLTTAALWVWSYPQLNGNWQYWPHIQIGSMTQRWYSLGVDRGTFKFAAIRGPFIIAPSTPVTYDWALTTPLFWTHGMHETAAPANAGAWLNVECWIVLLIAAILPARRMIVFRREHRLRQIEAGFCPNCGYDLRGTPKVSRCPECGTPRPSSI